MTVSVAQLVAALRAQAAELNSQALAGMDYAVAQQLRYHSRADPRLAPLGPAAADRLDELTVTRRTPGLSARWTTSRPRRRLVHGHAQITALALAPDGSFVVYATADLVVSRKSLVQVEDPPQLLGAVEHWVGALAMEPQGRWFVTGDRSGAVARWTLADHSAHKEVLGRHGHLVHAVAVDAGTGAVFSSDDDGTVARSDATGFREIIRLGRTCGSLAFDARTATLFTGDARGEIRRWDPAGADGALVGQLAGPVTALTVAPGSVLLGTARDGAIQVWERASGAASTPRVLGRVRKPLAGGIAVDGDRAVAVDTDGRVLAWDLRAVGTEPTVLGTNDWGARSVCAAAGVVVTGARDGFVLRWDDADPAVMPAAPMGVEICGLAVTPDGSAVVTGGGDGVHRWALTDPDRAPRPRLLWPTAVAGLGRLDTGEIVAWNDNGDILVGDLTEPGGELRIVGGHREFWGTAKARNGASATVRHLVVVPGSRSVVAAMDDGRILHRHLDGQHQGGRDQGGRHGTGFVGFHHAAVLAAAPDGAWVASVGDDRQVNRWSLDVPGGPARLGQTTARARALAVTADGRWVVTGDDHGEVRRFASAGASSPPNLVGRHRQHADAPLLRTKVRSVAVPDSGAWIASVADDGTIHLWNPADGSSTSLLPANLPRLAAPLGESLLVGGRHGALTLVDVVGGAATGPVPAQGPAADTAGVAQPVRTTDPPCSPNGTRPLRADPARSITLTLVLDQVWSQQVRAGGFLDLAALRADLSAGRVAEAVVPCPDIPALRGFRGFLGSAGWTVVDVPVDRAAQQARVAELAIEAAARNDVIVVSGEATVVAAVAGDANHARIAVVSDVGAWFRRR